MRTHTKPELEQIVADADVCADFDHTLIGPNSSFDIVKSYALRRLFAGDFKFVREAAALGIEYLLDKWNRSCPDQESIKKRAAHIKGFPQSHFKEYDLGRFKLNKNFLYAAERISHIPGINMTMLIITRNSENLVEEYLDSQYRYDRQGRTVREYLRDHTGFEFVAIGNDLEFKEGYATGLIAPGPNARALLGNKLVSILTKAELYTGNLVFSDREECLNIDLRAARHEMTISLSTYRTLHLGLILISRDSVLAKRSVLLNHLSRAS